LTSKLPSTIINIKDHQGDGDNIGLEFTKETYLPVNNMVGQDQTRLTKTKQALVVDGFSLVCIYIYKLSNVCKFLNQKYSAGRSNSSVELHRYGDDVLPAQNAGGV
jgi:hypothetical protein